jgi:hypothetical protein
MNAYRDQTNSMASDYKKATETKDYYYERALFLNNKNYNIFLSLKFDK